MSFASEAQELDFLAEKYITNFGIKTHKDLKKVGEFKKLPEDSQRKLYDKVRYKTQKGNLKLVTGSFSGTDYSQDTDSLTTEKIEANAKERDPSRALSKSTRKISTVIILLFIFSFLASESLKFYEQFNIHSIFKFSIPVVIETSIILLAIKNTKFSKTILWSLVVFNVAAFTFSTVQSDRNLKQIKLIANEKAIYFKNSNLMLLRELEAINEDKKLFENQFSSLINKGFYKVAQTTLSKKIDNVILRKDEISKKIENNNLEILKIGNHGESKTFLAIETIFMIALKVILQMTFLYLILDFKGNENVKNIS